MSLGTRGETRRVLREVERASQVGDSRKWRRQWITVGNVRCYAWEPVDEPEEPEEEDDDHNDTAHTETGADHPNESPMGERHSAEASAGTADTLEGRAPAASVPPPEGARADLEVTF
ncbi:hypothetical protein CDCA_CDCA03G0928 [Cyanidium caldarium]|uniref:Uncharacterized protein n=1 Tax=Cyanidium caldarium TaxID=2771 RepID=A0AAV9ISN9_CYACA|nr:hypothetical protein CDCA_CDCA03G0928 [Cyanidium caldarium]